jgi:catechol 2,3-dioxygenase-like lactoylglutathione lyase family enzyme
MLESSPISTTLRASDMKRVKHFYQEVLGLELVEEISETGELVFECGGTLLFVYPSGMAGTNQATSAALENHRSRLHRRRPRGQGCGVRGVRLR